MTSLVFKNSAGETINSWEEWTRPKKTDHWKEGRSAMMLARSWFTSQTPQCPPEIQALLATNTRTTNLHLTEGHPEYVTSLPERGEGRNHDLMLKANTDGESIVICIEAKVDEAFGETTIGKYWQEARDRQTPTRAPERIQKLLEIVFGATAQPNLQPWCGLCYQLLAAVAGTVIQAANCNAPLAVFVVHEFHTSSADPKKLRTNAEDYQKFVEALFAIAPVKSGQLYGPKALIAGQHLIQPVQLLVGKAVWQPVL